MVQNFKKFQNKEYDDYIKFFRKCGFEKRLKNLSRKYKDKKVLLYGNGIFFDALVDSYDLNSYFNVVGVSDIRYLNNKPDTYKNFKVLFSFFRRLLTKVFISLNLSKIWLISNLSISFFSPILTL